MLKNKIIKELKIHYVDLMTADFLLVLLKTYILFVIIEVAYILTKVARVAKLDFMGENGLHNERSSTHLGKVMRIVDIGLFRRYR